MRTALQRRANRTNRRQQIGDQRHQLRVSIEIHRLARHG